MELDELKKNWNALDEQLKKEPIANEKQIEELIVHHQANTRQSIKRLSGWQLFSICVGLVGLATLLIAWLIPSVFNISGEWRPRINTLVGFICVSLLIGIWWDYKTYRWIKGTNIEEMPVATVSRRIAIFRRWTRYEVICISAWIIIFNALNYWVMEYYKASAGLQAGLITFFVIFDVAIIYLVYKRITYKHINDIKRNVDKIEDICTE